MPICNDGVNMFIKAHIRILSLSLSLSLSLVCIDCGVCAQRRTLITKEAESRLHCKAFCMHLEKGLGLFLGGDHHHICTSISADLVFTFSTLVDNRIYHEYLIYICTCASMFLLRYEA